MNTYDHTKLLRSCLFPVRKSYGSIWRHTVGTENTDRSAAVVMTIKSTNLLFSEASLIIDCSVFDISESLQRHKTEIIQVTRSDLEEALDELLNIAAPVGYEQSGVNI